MGNVLHIDFETRSTVDLRKAGAHVYAHHETTDALCMAYAMDDAKVQIWKLGEELPFSIHTAIMNPKVTFAAHNAAFEFLIWNFTCVKKYGWPPLPINRFDCTMIRAYAMGLPGTLESAAKAVGMKHEKDMKGNRIMLQLCKPRKKYSDDSYIWWDVKDSTPKMDIVAKYESLYEYCKQDIIVERELDKRLLPLSKKEMDLWRLDQKINNRGVYLDETAAYKAIEIVKLEKEKFNKAMLELTKGDVKSCNASVAMREWIASYGVPCEGVTKAEVLDMLEIDALPGKIRTALLLRQEASKSSTAKIKAMITSKGEDSRVRGCLQYYGAPSTGRWAGRRIQLQNLKRPDITQDEIEHIMERLNEDDTEEAREYLNIFYGSAINPISSCIRAMLTAGPGKKLISADWNAIEGRVLAWLAGEEKTLTIYRGHGMIYEHTACQIYGIRSVLDVPKDKRLVGKVATLALGFQGGIGAFQSMAKIYFVKVSDEKADDIKLMWRAENPNIVGYWYDIERAAIAAVENPGQKFACGPKGRHVTFLVKGSFLFCRLPSGRAICYPYPKMRMTRTPWGEMKNALNYKGLIYGKFVRRVAYGGLITENVTQATARDLLAEAIPRLEAREYPVILHVHDEIVTEVDKNFGSVQAVEDIMCELPTWAKDLPITAGGWEGLRYRK